MIQLMRVLVRLMAVLFCECLRRVSHKRYPLPKQGRRGALRQRTVAHPQNERRDDRIVLEQQQGSVADSERRFP